MKKISLVFPIIIILFISCYVGNQKIMIVPIQNDDVPKVILPGWGNVRSVVKNIEIKFFDEYETQSFNKETYDYIKKTLSEKYSNQDLIEINELLNKTIVEDSSGYIIKPDISIDDKWELIKYLNFPYKNKKVYYFDYCGENILPNENTSYKVIANYQIKQERFYEYLKRMGLLGKKIDIIGYSEGGMIPLYSMYKHRDVTDDDISIVVNTYVGICNPQSGAFNNPFNRYSLHLCKLFHKNTDVYDFYKFSDFMEHEYDKKDMSNYLRKYFGDDIKQRFLQVYCSTKHDKTAQRWSTKKFSNVVKMKGVKIKVSSNKKREYDQLKAQFFSDASNINNEIYTELITNINEDLTADNISILKSSINPAFKNDINYIFPSKETKELFKDLSREEKKRERFELLIYTLKPPHFEIPKDDTVINYVIDFLNNEDEGIFNFNIRMEIK